MNKIMPLLIFVLCLGCFTAQAQTKTDTDITIVIQRQQVRFSGSGNTEQMRLELRNEADTVVYDSGLLSGTEITWTLQDSNEQALTSGLYVYTLTFKDANLETTHVRRGHIIIDRARDKTGDRLWITSQKSSEIGAELTISRGPDGTVAGASTTATSDTTGDDSTGRGGERQANASPSDTTQTVIGSGIPNQLVRITESTGRTAAPPREPISRSADGRGIVVVGNASGSNNGNGNLSARAVPPTSPGGITQQSVTGSGTANQAAKWTTSSNIGNSIITDTGTNVGIGTATPGSKLTVAGTIETSAQYNIGGMRVLAANGLENIFVGKNAGLNSAASSSNSFFGENAGRNTTGASNAFFGRQAGASNLIGSGNAFFGSDAGAANSIGINNVFFGSGAGFKNTFGSRNTFLGTLAGEENVSGERNVFAGYYAGNLNTTGQSNAFFGASAGEFNTTGNGNAFFGDGSGRANRDGSNNVFIGPNAGSANTAGSNNTLIGRDANVESGNLTNAMAIGFGAKVGCGGCLVLGNNANVGIGTTTPQAKLHIQGQTLSGIQLQVEGLAQTRVLQIVGGADFSENFDVGSPDNLGATSATNNIKPGLVVSIDPQKPGKLLVSKQAYDRKVAGIISGAGGIQPGMIMGQAGSLADGAQPVALSGRVYCWVDASMGAIQPGDLLTTSHTPGHAMKVKDHSKAQGAIIGKAMTSLKKGRGLVLVLVTLQ